jgi:hypothetical protein
MAALPNLSPPRMTGSFACTGSKPNPVSNQFRSDAAIKSRFLNFAFRGEVRCEIFGRRALSAPHHCF